MKLQGKVALVTGAARGLGRGYALRLAGLGADVVINDINLESAKEFDEELTAPTVIDELRALGRRSIGIQCDAANRQAIEAMFQQILSEFGRIDILVNNAGGLQVRPEASYASTMPEEDLRRELDRNLMSCIFCCQAAIPPMKAQGGGKIINVSSTAGLTGGFRGYYASYGAAKAAIIAYTRYLAGEVARYGIIVNCIAPGSIGTARLLARTYYGKTREVTERSIPLGRLGTVEDCAKVVEFLATDLSDYVVGQCIKIDGGQYLF
jgi:NAD(P)-dependent dehydrogenase (short-subunit alcohol dehydrogenase family)